MIRTVFAALALAALAPLGAAAQPSTPIRPGYWESTNTTHLLILNEVTHSKKCISPEQVEAYMSGPSTRHYRCVYDHTAIADGRAHLTGMCVDRKGNRLKVDVRGTYDPDHFKLAAQFRLKLLDLLPLAGVATTDAHRIADTCPPGTEGK